MAHPRRRRIWNPLAWTPSTDVGLLLGFAGKESGSSVHP